jgi:gliding motility-associated-like protein
MRADFFRNLFFVIGLFTVQEMLGQLSKVHYIPPIAAHGAANSNAFPRDQYIYISTPSEENVNYIIAPVGEAPGDYISGVVSNSFPQLHSIGSGTTNFAIANSDFYTGRVIDDKGFIITADAPIFVAIRLRASTRSGGTYPQAGALVSKGLSALGTSFRSGTFTSESPGADNNNANYLNFISVMASEDATQVTFDNLNKNLDLISIPSPSGTGTFSLTVELDRGEVYLIAAEADDAPANRDGLIGVSIESDRPIAVNTGSANGSFHNGGGRDYGIDQMVGADKIGKEYIFVKGNGNDGWENILIVAHQDDTDIFLDGDSSPIANLAQAGDYYLIEGDAFGNQGSNRTLHVSTSKNVFAWQGTGTGSEANQGMFFVPPLSCQSQGEVNNIPQIDFIGTSLFSGFVTVVTNQTASITFSDADNTDKSMDDASFSGGVFVIGPESVEGADYKAYILQNLSGNVSIKSTEELYCSYFNQNGAATSGGFYSGFVAQPETVIRSPNLQGEKCLPNVELLASGIEAYDSFKWLFDDGTGFVDLGVSDNPYVPLNPGAYKIEAQITCKGVTSIAYSKPTVVSNCPPDFDGDGINDNIDLDLDNDGILNVYETLGTYALDISDFSNPLILETASTTTAGAYSVTSMVASNSSIGQTEVGEITSILEGGGKQNQIQWSFNSEVNFKLTHTLVTTHTYLEGEFFVISVDDPTKSISLLNPNNNLLVDTNYDNTYESGLSLYSANEIRFKFNPSSNVFPTFSFLGENTQNINLTHINENPTETAVFKWDLSLHQNDLDTDGDGTPDAYDLESDGDTCSDVIEAGFTDSDPVPDGILGASPVTVSSMGLVAGYDGYVVPRDGDLSGTYDFQEVGSPAIASNITSPPDSQSLCLGSTASFEVQTDLTDPIYQWQIYDGTNWIDLSDNAIYSNTHSQVMNITPADNSLDNAQYRVNVAKRAYLCSPAISVSATLDIAPPKTFSLNPAVLNLSETDSPTSFLISLDEAPASNVVLDISNPDITEAIVSPTQITFTPFNWNVQQAISIAPQMDELLDGDQIIYPIVSVHQPLTQNCYTNAEAQTVTLTVLDADTADFEIIVLDNLTDENGGEATFTVKLLSKPNDIVVLDLISSDLTEGQVNQNEVEFSPTNWNIPQTVVVTGLPDPVPFKDGNIAYQIITANVSSTDANYNALDGSTVDNVNLINQDNTAPGIVMTVVGGDATTDENGSSFDVQFNLLSRPFGGGDVSFGLTILGDIDEASLSTTSITILNDDWNKPFNNQVTLTGLDDNLIDGDIFLVLETADPSSSDGVYDALQAFDIADLIFRNLDNDQPGFSISPISNNLSENENIGSFTVVLSIEPNSDVFFQLASNESSEVEVVDGFRQLHFTPANWNIPQTVLVKGVDDSQIDGDQFTQITVAVDPTSEPSFLSEPAQSINVINTDNDNAQFIITPIDLLTSENGDTGSFSVALSASPSDPVQIFWSSSNTNEGTVSGTMTFDSTDWDQPKVVNIIGVDDLVPMSDGASSYNIYINEINSADPNFGNIIPANILPVIMTNQDNDFAGINIHLEENDNQTDENGDGVKIGFSLNSKPLDDADVILTLSLNRDDEIALFQTEITIKNENWDSPLSNVISLTGLDDFLLDGDQNVNFITGDPQSLDLSYDQLNASSVADLILVNLDNDFPGIVLSGALAPVPPTVSGAVTTSFNLLDSLNESGTFTTISFQLNTRPKSDVIIRAFVPDPTEIGLSKNFLTFTPENWDQPQAINLLGIDDYLFDGNIATELIFSVDPVTADTDYNGIDFISVSLIVEDDDIDPDEDGLHELFDNCPQDYNPEQEDWDGDGVGDLCDPDIDGDGVPNTQEASDQTEPYDNCDFLSSSVSLPITIAFDCDYDGVFDDEDLDDDNDGILDTEETQEDFDQNGRVNSLDLDSDGDGCFDVIEAGFEDPDQDGILGITPVEVDSQGRVVGAGGYTTPADQNASGERDFLELPQIPLINQQPSPLVVVFPGQDIGLNIVVSTADQISIQWQILKPSDNTWKDIQDSANFSGVNTPNLVMVNPQESWVPWKFRAAISSNAYPCEPLIFSQVTELEYQPLKIPNAFSPDNDGVNETWIIEGLGKFPQHELTIYSRWESVILNEAPYQNDWAGELRAAYSNSKSRNIPEGTYFYILDLGNGQPSLKGFIYLKR